MSNPYSSPEQTDVNVATLTSAIETAVRGLQMILLGLVGGIVIFTAIALIMTQGAIDGEPDILSWIGLAFAAFMIVNHLIVPSVVSKSLLANITAQQVRDADEASKFQLIFPAFRTKTIVAAAMLEGAAFMNLTMYLITKYVGNLAAAGFLTILIFGRLTSTTAANFWVNDRSREIEMR